MKSRWAAGRKYAVALGMCVAAACSENSTGPEARGPNEVDETGGTVTSADNRVSLEFPAGAVSGDIVVSVVPVTSAPSNEHVAASTVYEFGPDGTQFSQPVMLRVKYADSDLPAGVSKSSLRIAKEVNGEWIEIANTTVDSVNRVLGAPITSFSKYGVKANPCTPGALQAGTSSGSITRHDCLYTTPHRRSDYFDFTVTTAAVYNVSVAGANGLTGLFGIKAWNADPATGLVWGSVSMGTPLRTALRPGRYQLYVSGQDTTKLGTYTLTTSTSPTLGNLDCDDAVSVMPGTTNEAMLTTESCEITLVASVNPAFNGQKSRADYYALKVEAGKSYEFTATITTPNTNIALAIIAAGQFVGVDGSLADKQTKRLTFNATQTGYIYVEVSASTLSPTTWTAPLGGYRVTFSD